MNAAPAASVDDLVAAALALHADHPQDAAALLVREAPPWLAQATAEALGGLMRTAEHVLIGHLDDLPGWQCWQALCEADLRRLALWQDEQDRLAVQMALRAGHAAPLHRLALPQQVRAHGNVVLALTRGRHWAAVREGVEAARALAMVTPPDRAAQAAFAALTNNLAADLRYYWRGADPEVADMMVAAALWAREAWAQAGGWLERERADWQVVMCAATVGDSGLAQHHAQACWQTCEAEGADAFECCFAWQAMAWAAIAADDTPAAHLARREMAGRVDGLGDAADRDYARRCLADLDARLVT